MQDQCKPKIMLFPVIIDSKAHDVGENALVHIMRETETMSRSGVQTGALGTQSQQDAKVTIPKTKPINGLYRWFRGMSSYASSVIWRYYGTYNMALFNGCPGSLRSSAGILRRQCSVRCIGVRYSRIPPFSQIIAFCSLSHFNLLSLTSRM